MDEIWSIIGVFALWIGASTGLWWLHRHSVRARQKRQIDHAIAASECASEAQAAFDAIRASERRIAALLADSDLCAAETHALLKRIHRHGRFFDRVNTLRVQMQALIGVDDHAPLSEILHLRRDLWAAAEIILIEDPASLGSSFAEDGAYERFRGEAVRLLFKTAEAGATEDDPIDLRIALARRDAGTFVAELEEAIRAAREKDRLPTFAELTAYPLRLIRALPRRLARARVFFSELLAYSSEIANQIRRSRTMARGRRHLRQAREDLPRRLSAGFERASSAARGSAASLRKHYDFLVAAHDFQSRYDQMLARAPQITERGRQFIVRLELAERSERLRLTSANAAIWLARRLADAMGLLIAGLRRLHAAASRTTPWAMAAALVAPAPVKGRRQSRFRSYRMALAASGLAEPAAAPAAPADIAPARTSRAAPAKARKAARPASKTRQPKKAAANGKSTPVTAASAKTEARPKNKAGVTLARGTARRAPSQPVMSAKSEPVADRTEKPADGPKPLRLPFSRRSTESAKAATGRQSEPASVAPEPAAQEPLSTVSASSAPPTQFQPRRAAMIAEARRDNAKNGI